jgi:hypothetical protein
LSAITSAAPLLPVAYGALLAVALRGHDGIRAGLLRASVVFGVTVAMLTESLTLAHAIKPGVVTSAWIVLTTLALVACWRAGSQPRGEPFTWRAGILLLPIGALAGVALVVALAAPPNTWDAMNYHMGRVLQWSQNGDVEFFRTDVQRQLFLAPWAEYAILHFQVLSNDDRFANVVQWCAYVGCVVVGSLIARDLGAPKLGQWLAAAIIASLPMGILQASSAQNDLVLSLWLGAFAWFGLRAITHDDAREHGTATRYAAAALALAVATKGTAFIVGGMFLGFGLVAASRRWPRRRVAVFALVVGLAVGSINAPLWVRNWRLYDDPLGERMTMSLLRAQRFGGGELVSSVTRNLALHLGTPWTGANQAVEGVVRCIHRVIGIDPNDPDLTWRDAGVEDLAFRVPPLNRDEDRAGNLLGLLLIAGASALWALRGIRLRIGWYGTACTAAALAFAAMLRWQPWHSRLHLPLFVLGAAWAAAIYAKGLPRRWLLCLGSVSLLAGLPWAVSAHHRPLMPLSGDPTSVLESPRSSQYFAAVPDLHGPFEGAAGLIAHSGCRDVGFMGTEAALAYALWGVMRWQGPGARVVPVHVANRSRRVPDRPSQPPCAIVAQRIPGRRWPDPRQWQVQWQSGDLVLFRRAP